MPVEQNFHLPASRVLCAEVALSQTVSAAAKEGLSASELKERKARLAKRAKASKCKTSHDSFVSSCRANHPNCLHVAANGPSSLSRSSCSKKLSREYFTLLGIMSMYPTGSVRYVHMFTQLMLHTTFHQHTASISSTTTT